VRLRFVRFVLAQLSPILYSTSELPVGNTGDRSTIRQQMVTVQFRGVVFFVRYFCGAFCVLHCWH
jgi:hypothetical protein